MSEVDVGEVLLIDDLVSLLKPRFREKRPVRLDAIVRLPLLSFLRSAFQAAKRNGRVETAGFEEPDIG